MRLAQKLTAGGKIEIPMSSMIDVVFLLLIFFIVTHREELSEAHLAVNLPSPNPAVQAEVRPRLLELEVHPGQVFLQGIPRPIPVLRDRLGYLAENDPDLTVTIKTSQMARTKDLVQVLDLCRGVGLTNLNLVTLK